MLGFMRYITDLRVVSLAVHSLFACMALASCDGSPPKNAPSRDMQHLGTLVRMDIPIVASQWEEVEYPEDLPGMLPTNHESTVLLAEIYDPDPRWFAKRSDEITIRRVRPNYVRKWMAPESKKILNRASFDLSKHDCQHYSAIVVRSGQLAPGFTCRAGRNVLLRYADFSGHSCLVKFTNRSIYEYIKKDVHPRA